MTFTYVKVISRPGNRAHLYILRYSHLSKINFINCKGNRIQIEANRSTTIEVP